MFCLLTEKEEDNDEGGSMSMEDEIWRALPEYLLFAILALLPLSPFLRFRSVCKRWNALLRYPSPFFSYPPVFYNKLFTILNTSSVVEHQSLELQHQQQRKRDCIGLTWRPFEVDFLHPSDYLESSHSGLVLIRRTYTRFLVCNPVLRVSTELPQAPIQTDFVPLTGIFRINPSSTSFKVLCAEWFTHITENDGELLRSILYDSSIRTWKNIVGRPFNLKNTPFIYTQICRSSGVLCKNICYWCTFTSNLLGFDFERETWLTIETIGLPASMPESMFYVLSHWKDHLMMIRQDDRRVCIWLSSMGNSIVWHKIDTLTEDAMPCGFCVDHCTCVGKILLLHDFTGRKLVVYNFASKDSIFCNITNDSPLFVKGFVSFYPTLEALDPHSLDPHSL